MEIFNRRLLSRITTRAAICNKIRQRIRICQHLLLRNISGNIVANVLTVCQLDSLAALAITGGIVDNDAAILISYNHYRMRFAVALKAKHRTIVVFTQSGNYHLCSCASAQAAICARPQINVFETVFTKGAPVKKGTVSIRRFSFRIGNCRTTILEAIV